jgi:RNA polymerase sigma factor (TIGR02999 family)
VGEVTLAIDRLRAGDPAAAEKLLVAVYDELRRLAEQKMARESAAVTLQPTSLVHEAWQRLGGPEQPAWANRAHFFAAAAEAMRRILIDRARRRQAVRHGGGQARVEISLDAVAGEIVRDEELLAVHEALDRLASVDPAKAELVKLRYFVGLTIEEAAEALGISTATAKRWWAFSRAWLHREITDPA